MRTRLTLQDFMEALGALDNELAVVQARMSIKAIGGFALLWHSMRGTGYTADIDSISKDFPPKVLAAIEKVSQDLDLPKDWVNNYNVLGNDIEAVELMLEPLWLKSNTPFKQIDLWIADLETLLRSKLYAAEDFDINHRTQDWPDLVELFKQLKCHSHAHAVQYCRDELYIDLQAEYPQVYEKLKAVQWDTNPTGLFR